MKAILEIELFNEDLRKQMDLACKIVDSVSGERRLGTQMVGRLPPSGWVAEITGPSEKYRFERKFLRAKKDYSRANGKGSRGVYAEYILESGRYYDVQRQITWGRSARYFCTVTEDGDIRTVDESEVCSAFGVQSKEQGRGKSNAKKVP